MLSREQYREHLEMFSQVMQVPHGDLTAAMQVHKQVCDRNPLFYAKFSVWYMDNGTVRDHKVAFLQTLFNAKEPELREAAWMLTQDLPLELIYRVIDKKYPRSMRSAIINKLANEDARTMQFQILRAKKQMKRLVKRLHIPTSKSENENLQAIGKELFSKDTELRAVFKQLSATEDPEEIKKLLQKSRLPAYIAVSSIKVRNPKVMRALIDNMSPAELLQSLNTLGLGVWCSPLTLCSSPASEVKRRWFSSETLTDIFSPFSPLSPLDTFTTFSPSCIWHHRHPTEDKPARLCILTNGVLTKIYNWSNSTPIAELKFEDFQDGNSKFSEFQKKLSKAD